MFLSLVRRLPKGLERDAGQGEEREAGGDCRGSDGGTAERSGNTERSFEGGRGEGKYSITSTAGTTEGDESHEGKYCSAADVAPIEIQCFLDTAYIFGLCENVLCSKLYFISRFYNFFTTLMPTYHP